MPLPNINTLFGAAAGRGMETLVGAGNDLSGSRMVKSQRGSQKVNDWNQLQSMSIKDHGMAMQAKQNEFDIRMMGTQANLGMLKDFANMQATATGKTGDALKQLVK